MKAMRSNFDFLEELDGDLSNLGRLAESYFQDDPRTSLIKIRQYCEQLTKRHAARMGTEVQENDTQADLLRKLKYERAAPDRVLDVLHHVRKLGNAAVHEGRGDHREALACLKMAVQLGVWHVRVTTVERDFSPSPFLPPKAPDTSGPELQVELERLRLERNNALTSAQKAEEEKRIALLAAETAEDRHGREIEERRTWEALAQDADRQLQELSAQARHQSSVERIAFAQAAEDAAAGAIVLDEQATRALIDQQLRDSYWEADTSKTRSSVSVTSSVLMLVQSFHEMM